MNRLLIAGTHSGCGKTTVTCALLAALKARGLEALAFKCGPDYIDPMFHREVTGVRAHNLDAFFLRRRDAARPAGFPCGRHLRDRGRNGLLRRHRPGRAREHV